ncbi:cytochrome P450 [Kutzneria sp. CA-103260]|uniref:cytochrome P450 n=1 Tax=Kutzneria sp. CA-103260 TaxID=2802641 RepID=UPI001BA57815|nr:cytochrome P450 [Kutzneria sp. CA-103260]QUQ70051.1 cytochrome P450 [Kutzneria sp. CA-103260]
MSHLDKLPLARATGCPFDPPAELGAIREQNPLVRMTYPDGHRGWLATGYAETRAVLADQRFSSRYELAHFPMPGAEDMGEFPPAPPGDMTGIDAPEHTRYRKQLVGKFTVRRMQQLTDRVEQVTAEHLAAMAQRGPEADLVRDFAYPVPAVMICELLGVPYEDRETFQRLVEGVLNSNGTPEDVYTAYGAVMEYIGTLIEAKRSAPTDDLLSDLTTGSDFNAEELAGIGAFLLGAGLDTTANQLALGTFALLRNPDQVAGLLADPDRAVEELMRYLTITPIGVRAALEDVELGGQLIKAGESVTFSMAAANRDPERFPDPDRLDLSRDAVGHLGFGHGIHQCLGQQLARVEMRVAFPALFRKFPTLRLAGEVELRPDHQNIYGVRRLPVSWDRD